MITENDGNEHSEVAAFFNDGQSELASFAVKHAPVIAVVLDAAGRVVYYNDYWAQLSGRPLAEMRGRVWFDEFVLDEDRLWLQGVLDRAIAGEAVDAHVSHVRMRGGPPRLVEWYSRTVARGSARHVVAIGVDISKRIGGARARLARGEAREQEGHRVADLRLVLLTAELEAHVAERTRTLEREREHLQRILDGMPMPVVLLDAEGRYRQLNRCAREQAGEHASRLIGRRHGELFGWFGFVNERPEQLEHALQLALAGHSTRYDLVLRKAQGGRQVQEVMFGPIRGADGRVEEIVLATLDVTEARATAHDLRNLVAEKDALLNEIHHRVKNNLQIVASLLYLQSRQESPRVRMALDECGGRIRTMALIHEQLYESSGLSLIEMHEVLVRLASDLAHTFGGPRGPSVHVSGPGLTLDINRALPVALIANELLTNAIKYAYPEASHAGAVRVYIGAEGLEVADDGVGLPAGLLPEQAGSLGMRLVYSLVRQLDAELSFECTAGTRACLRLPTSYACSATLGPSTSGKSS